MTAVRFVHTADWQLGMTRRFLSPEAQARFAAARLDAVRAVGRLAGEQGADFVVVCGDVVESNHVDRQVVVRALDALRAYPVDVYLLPGNHDPLDPGSVYTCPTFTAHCPSQVHVLDGHPVTPRPGVEIVGAPWRSKQPLEDLVEAACAPLRADGAIRVVAGHGAVDQASPDRHNPALIGQRAAERLLEEGRVHYVALGDRHSVTSVGDSGRIWYSGAPEVTDYDEIDPGKALVVALDGDGIQVAPHRVGTWQFLRRSFDVDGPADVDAVADWLDAIQDKDRTVCRLGFVGTLDLRERARLDDVLAHHADLLAALDTWEAATDLAVVCQAGDLGEFGLDGYADAAVQQLAADAAQVGPQAVPARDALSLLYRLAAGTQGGGT